MVHNLKIQKVMVFKNGIKGTSEQILIFFFYVFHVIACDKKISIYNVNSPYKQKVYSLELFLVIFR